MKMALERLTITNLRGDGDQSIQCGQTDNLIVRRQQVARAGSIRCALKVCSPGSVQEQENSHSRIDKFRIETAVVWSCLPFIRSGQNHLATHSERGKKTKQTEEKVGRPQGIDRPGVRQVSVGSGEQGKMEETCSEIICGAPTTLAIKG